MHGFLILFVMRRVHGLNYPPDYLNLQVPIYQTPSLGLNTGELHRVGNQVD